ncbi:MAG: caspase family protein, partial [Cellvibrionaceae bacterium]|nr:caspase family protein [Cellvibrionaceae bacterium]
ALVIANQDYSELNSLNTVSNDARALAEVLEQQYGFEVRLLINADRLSVMRAVNQLSESLGEDDNLLIYYGGHGSRLETGEREEGYWLPVNANPPPNDSRWVPNEFISNHLARLKAKRVLVVSDSCYAGLLSSSPGYLFFNARGQQRSQTETKAYIDYKLPRRSRLLLTSGGDKPVIDNGNNGHSVFANALLQKLRSNKTILTAPELFMGVLDRVSESAAKYDFLQQPEYKSIKGAGHEVGDFFFVPSAS